MLKGFLCLDDGRDRFVSRAFLHSGPESGRDGHLMKGCLLKRHVEGVTPMPMGEAR
jgi:hypothetical protein